eukprot:jgi/Tetstr1/439389/TSEL_027824.t1
MAALCCAAAAEAGTAAVFAYTSHARHPPSSSRLRCFAGPGPGSSHSGPRVSRMPAVLLAASGACPAGGIAGNNLPRNSRRHSKAAPLQSEAASAPQRLRLPGADVATASALNLLRRAGVDTGRCGPEGVALVTALEEGALPRRGAAVGVLRHLVAARQAREAADAFRELDTAGVDFSYADYHCMVAALVKAEQPHLARQIFRGIVTAGFSPNIVTYCMLISGLSRAARKRKRGLPYGRMAFEVWRELDASALVLDAYAIRTGINAAMGHGQYEAARQLLGRLQDSGQLDATAFNMLLKGFADSGRFEDAREVLDEMMSSQVEPDAWTFSTLANAHVRGGDLSGARQVLRMALDAGVKGDMVSAYTAVLKGYAQAGQMEEVARLLNEMQGAGVAPTDITLAALVDALIRNSQMDRALGFVDVLSRQGVPITIAGGIPVREALGMLDDLEQQEIWPTVDTYNILMGGCCRCEQPAGARVLFNRMVAAGLPPDGVSYTTLMKSAVMEEDFEAAVKVFAELESDASGMEPDGVALNLLAYVLVNMGRLREARDVLEQVDALAARTNSVPSVQGYGAVVMGFARRNLPEETVELMKRYRQRGGVPDQHMYNSVAGMYARSRDWTRALRVVQAMEQRGHEADRAMLISITRRLEEAMEWEANQEEDAGSRDLATRKRMPFNEGFERFKFWLGLPNRYYNASWDLDDD